MYRFGQEVEEKDEVKYAILDTEPMDGEDFPRAVFVFKYRSERKYKYQTFVHTQLKQSLQKLYKPSASSPPTPPNPKLPHPHPHQSNFRTQSSRVELRR